MILLITTSKSFITLDLETYKADIIDTGKGLYYGITFSDESIFVAARNNENCFDYLDDRDKEDGSILVFDYNLKLIDIFKAPFPLRDLHQILFHDNKLWMTCAFDDMIVTYDFSHWERWSPFGNEENVGKDIYHFNSLWTEDGHLYILAHNNGPSEIWQFSYPDLQLQQKIKLGDHGHNIWKQNGDLFTCNSKCGTVESSGGFGLRTGEFPRGVVITEDLSVVGVSDIAERTKRHLVSSRLLIYDIEWNLLSKIQLDGYGQVLEIRCPGIKDICSASTIGKVPNNLLLKGVSFEVPHMKYGTNKQRKRLKKRERGVLNWLKKRQPASGGKYKAER